MKSLISDVASGPNHTSIRRKAVVLMAVATMGMLGGCSRSVSYRVQMTVDDHGRKYTGTGVWRSTISGNRLFGYHTVFAGEAIPIDMGRKGTLYALIVGRTQDGHPTALGDLDTYGRHLFGEVARQRRGQPIKHLNPMQEYQELATMVGQSATLDCAHPPTRWTSCPFLVRFHDENDPASVAAVDPNNLASTYGSGVRLDPIMVTITDEPVTVGLRQRLKWLDSIQGSLLKRRADTPIGSMPIAGQLTNVSFSYGVDQ